MVSNFFSFDWCFANTSNLALWREITLVNENWLGYLKTWKRKGQNKLTFSKQVLNIENRQNHDGLFTGL